MFDVSKVPFSRFGSYFSLSVNSWGTTGKALYLRAHFSKSPQVFRIDPVCDGKVVEYTIETSPSQLTLKPETGGQIEFVISGAESIRLRGRGTSIRLTMPNERWTFAYQLPEVWAFNFSPYSLQLALETMNGTLAVDAPWEKGPGFCWETSGAVATLSPDKDETFEAAIDCFETTWIKPARPDFDACRKEVEKEYTQWTQNLPQAEQQHQTTRDLAAYVNWSAVLEPAGNLTRRTMLMSKYSMCNIYHWDHAFNAMAHCRHQPDLAWDQLMAFYDKQDKFGKCPSSMNRNEIRYTISNPPVQGWALRRMWNQNPAMFTPERLKEAYDYLSRWTEWLCHYRTWSGDKLPFYHHGFCSGWDNSSIFDQGVPVVSPDQPAYLILQMEALADIADALHQTQKAAEWRMRAKEMLAALIECLWKDDRFIGILRPSGKQVICQSLITCMPIVLGKRLPDEIMKHLIQRVQEYMTPFGLATENPKSEKFQEGGYWRGPIWAPSTMLVVSGLIDVGADALANKIMTAFCKLCADHGFHENFSPSTGEGHYCPSYTWTSSVFMIFQEHLNANSKP